jgi:hypothetical protein
MTDAPRNSHTTRDGRSSSVFEPSSVRYKPSLRIVPLPGDRCPGNQETTRQKCQCNYIMRNRISAHIAERTRRRDFGGNDGGIIYYSQGN